MESNLKKQTQLLTLSILNVMKLSQHYRNDIPESAMHFQECQRHLGLAMEQFLAATSPLRPPSSEDSPPSNEMEMSDNNHHPVSEELSMESGEEMTGRRRYRSMGETFTHEMRIKHQVDGDEWIATYDHYKDVLFFREKSYPTLYSFVKDHYYAVRGRYVQTNAWRACKYEKEGKWLSVSYL